MTSGTASRRRIFKKCHFYWSDEKIQLSGVSNVRVHTNIGEITEKNRNQKILRLRKQDLRSRANRDGTHKKNLFHIRMTATFWPLTSWYDTGICSKMVPYFDVCHLTPLALERVIFQWIFFVKIKRIRFENFKRCWFGVGPVWKWFLAVDFQFWNQCSVSDLKTKNVIFEILPVTKINSKISILLFSWQRKRKINQDEKMTK